ncbi:hypothetical protein B0H19DRAFT_1268181 [Mycena capillaripes]|nr:hypothetical protein B0H19DRAFT_1268181 [Mycena capillaripes]
MEGKVRVKGLFDGGAMVAVMDKAVWEKIRNELGGGKPSRMKLRMASGQIVKSEATWEGVVEVDGVRVEGTFEVFDSGGGWEFLFGKPLQATFGAIHNYRSDTVSIEAGGKSATLTNQQEEKKTGKHEPAAERAAFTGVLSFANTPTRRVHSKSEFIGDSVDKQNGPENIKEEHATREELAHTTTVEEVATEESAESEAPAVQTKGQTRMVDKWPFKRAISTGARATPVRESN